MEKKYVLALIVFVFIASGFFYRFVFRVQTLVDTGNPTTNIQKVDKPVAGQNTLDLSNQGLDKVPSSVFNMSNLEELNLSHNNLTGALPSQIQNLKKLRVLNASNNAMTGVPAEVGQLQNLEILDLSNNQLTGLPNELANLKKLKIFNLSGNNYSQQDLEVIKKGLSPSVEIIL